MDSSRRKILGLTTGAAALLAMSRGASAQAYPTRPVRWVVGFAPAGGNDIVARLMGQWLSERTGQQFIIENRPGAMTNIASEYVIRSAPEITGESARGILDQSPSPFVIIFLSTGCDGK